MKHRFDEDYVPDQRLVAAASYSYGVHTNWYTDTSATDHVTGELDKLIVKNKYHGNDQIHTASGTGMDISHIGHTTVRTPSRDIHLKMSSMFHKPRKILHLFIVLLPIILLFLSFTMMSSSLRIRKRRIFFLKGGVATASIRFHLHQ
jgi:hypothetical protein